MDDAPMKVYGKNVPMEAAEARQRAAAKLGCDNLLRAHLRAGQHILAYALAVKLGATLGVTADDVRPAFGDPTIKAAA